MAKNFNDPRVVENYDQHIRCLIPGYELMHLQIQAILSCHLKSNAKILIAGCGTGYELQYLARQFPQATFVAIDPSLNMIDAAKKRLTKEQDLARVDFIHGDSSVLLQYSRDQFENNFDAALAILVSHFITEPEKNRYFKDLNRCIKQEGLIISYDLMQMDQETQQILSSLAQLNGLTEQQSQNMIARLEHDFTLIEPEEMNKLLAECGFENVRKYMQISGYHGFYGFKASVI
jgi:tRNA (cmo5U34)-methyltransferase